MSLLRLRPPDILVSGDGKHVGITGLGEGGLTVLREGRSDFARDNLLETAGETRLLSDGPSSRCSRGQDRIEKRNLAAPCERADTVIADR